MRFLLLLSILLAGLGARAEVLASIGTTLSYESSTNGREYTSTQPLSLRAGYRFSLVDAYVEYSHSESTQGTSYVHVADEREQALVWGRYVFPTTKVAPFVAVGAGFVTETIHTNFQDQDRSDTGVPQSDFSAAAGVIIPMAKRFEATIELRGDSSAAFVGGYAFGGSVFAGMKF